MKQSPHGTGGLDGLEGIMSRIIEWIKDLFSLHCEACGVRLKSKFLDMELDKMVYKCEKCGKEWC